MQSQNIRIRLKAFDHRILDASTKEIVNTAKMTMTVAFSESDISKIKVGQPATVTLDFDATLVDAHSDKQDAKPTYKRGFGFCAASRVMPRRPYPTGIAPGQRTWAAVRKSA
jgi:hypothetical protein